MTYRSMYASGYKQNYNFQPATDIQVDDIVWIKWQQMHNCDIPMSATPTTVIKVYNDGNIIHHRRGYDDPEFAWGKDIYAKSPGLNLYNLSFRTVKLSEISEALMELATDDN